MERHILKTKFFCFICYLVFVHFCYKMFGTTAHELKKNHRFYKFRSLSKLKKAWLCQQEKLWAGFFFIFFFMNYLGSLKCLISLTLPHILDKTLLDIVKTPSNVIILIKRWYNILFFAYETIYFSLK